MVSIATEVNKCDQAKEDILILCKDTTKDGLSLLARNKKNGLIVGYCFNKIQCPSDDNPNAPTYFEWFRDNKCKSPSSKALMDYMIEMDSKINLFQHFNVDCLLELTFLGVISEYAQQGIATKLCAISIDIAKALKDGKNLELLKPHIKDKIPKLVCAQFSSRFSQRVGQKLNFQTLYEVSHDKFIYNGQSYASRIGSEHPTSTLAVKEI